jgi:hypothetical protein
MSSTEDTVYLRHWCEIPYNHIRYGEGKEGQGRNEGSKCSPDTNELDVDIDRESALEGVGRSQPTSSARVYIL